MPLAVDIGVPVSAPIADQIAYIKRAEELGFAGIGVGDTLSSAHDLFVTMALAAPATRRVTLYAAVVNPVTRHPIILTNLARSMAEHIPGRFKLGIGRGGRELPANGIRRADLGELRRAIEVVRNGLREGNDQWAPPVVLGASGPRALGLAGELADEVILQVGPDQLAREAALKHVREGATTAGRWLQDIPITDYFIVSVAEDKESALQRALPWVQYMIGVGTFQLALAAHRVEVEDLITTGRLTGGWHSHRADMLVVAGTPSEVAERFSQMAAAGVQRVCCMVPGGPRTHWNTLEALGRHVLPVVS